MEEHINQNEVLIEETFHAGIERVFDAWTDPKKLMKCSRGMYYSFQRDRG